MESQMESIDISSIKAVALRPPQRPDLEDNPGNGRLRAIQEASQTSATATTLDKLPGTHHHHNGTLSQPAQFLNASDSLPFLASTVPDSQIAANVESILQKIPHASVPDVLPIFKMSSQGGAPHDTQPLSPAFIESILKKARALEDNNSRHDYGNEPGATNHTLHKGNEGHVDLLSSYKEDEIFLDDEVDSEPVDFSPTQSHLLHLSQFPESQRFKTPATVGKKRTYKGDKVESPVLPRNPLARNREPTPGRMMGLSQAFAVTQAGSSPFLNVLPSEIRSDRPSPNMAMQARLGSAIEQSPLQTRAVLPGSSTEPQTRYVSVKESQARRAAQKRMELDGNRDEDSDDSFDDTPRELRRLREKSERDAEAAREFQAMAAARSPTEPWSSPVKKARKCNITSSISPKVILNKLMSDLSEEPEVPQEEHDGANASEEETEEEDEADVAVRRSSQLPRRGVPEEDKENTMIGAMQVPETAALYRVINGFATEVETSPSVQPGSEKVRSYSVSQIVKDVEPFVVANSQPSQSGSHQVLTGANRRLRSSGEQTDFVPQSPAMINGTSGPSMREETRKNEQTGGHFDNKSTKQHSSIFPQSGSNARSSVAETSEEIPPPSPLRDDDKEVPSRRTLRSQAAPHSTIPETSSKKLIEGCDHRAQSFLRSFLDWSTEPVNATKSLSEFDTAPTQPQPSANDSGTAILPSTTVTISNPIKTKRRRMDEIDAESSQRSSGPNFDGLNPILDDTDFNEMMGSSSPIRPGRFAKRRRLYGSPLRPSRSRHQDPFLAPSNNEERQVDIKEMDRAPAADLLALDRGPSPLEQRLGSSPRSRNIGRLSVPSREVVKTTYGSSRSKLSAWDIDLSPPQTIISKRTGKRTSLHKPPSTRQSRTAEHPFTSPRMRRTRAAQLLPVDGPYPLSMSAARPTAESRGPPDGRVVAPNQVFACFNGKVRAYYPAKCLGVCGVETTRYQVQWQGYDPDELDAHGVRSLDLRSGDFVKVSLKGFPRTAHIIRGFKNKAEVVCGVEDENITDIRGYKTLLVVAKPRRSLPANAGPDELREVPVSAIYLDSNMWAQMKDRTFEFVASALTQALSRPGFSTPMDRPSTPNTPGSRSRRLAVSNSVPNTAAPTTVGLFSNMAFAISYDDPSRKSTLTQLITSNGGLVLNAGFHELLTEDLGLKPQFANLGFAALLADKHSRKEKYMQALALGLPCLSGKWIETCIASNGLTIWQSYLLPAGESAELEGAVRSRVLPDVDVANTKITSLLLARPNVLDGASVLFVLGRGKAEEKRRPYLFLTQALGAGKVVKVADISSADAQLQLDREVEWVLVDDRDVAFAKALFTKRGRLGMYDSAKVRGNEFVKQSLILGRMYGGGDSKP